ncbi:MAG: sulfite exporter TauE/SafE family protein, partial [Betaproteobacteria bacterium]|nr:sulfite exporter TauE/SafE family protein [Betaproteobacteria bacterium]
IPGIWLGSRLIQRTSDRVIRSLLSGLLAWAGLKLISI